MTIYKTIGTFTLGSLSALTANSLVLGTSLLWTIPPLVEVPHDAKNSRVIDLQHVTANLLRLHDLIDLVLVKCRVYRRFQMTLGEVITLGGGEL